MHGSVATSAIECAELFVTLSRQLKESESQRRSALQQVEVKDQLQRYKIWAGNLGAFQRLPSKASLDHRLRDSKRITIQIQSLLEDLLNTLLDLSAIALGNKPNRTHDALDYCGQGLEVDDDVERLSSPQHAYPPSANDGDFLGAATTYSTEARELLESAKNTIANLFRLSIIIRKASPRDRFAQALVSGGAPFDEGFDVRHVYDKFPALLKEDATWLGKRLGQAITQRRQYLRYARDHREKLGQEATNSWQPSVPDALRTLDQQTTISKQTSATTLNPAELPPAMLQFEDEQSQTSSILSVSTSIGDSRLYIPYLADVSKGELNFECPFCWMIQSIAKESTWQKHAFSDLRPYVCTFADCDAELFANDKDWLAHELQHRVHWGCHFCSSKTFKTVQGIREHLSLHMPQLTEDQLDALSEAAQLPVDRIPALDCPFCDIWEAKLRQSGSNPSAVGTVYVTPSQFRKHVGSHMRQLALFAIPKGYIGEDNGDGSTASDAAIPATGFSTPSISSIDNDGDKAGVESTEVREPKQAVEVYQGEKEGRQNALDLDDDASLKKLRSTTDVRGIDKIDTPRPDHGSFGSGPSYLFRIDEVTEHPQAASQIDQGGHWRPSSDLGDTIRVGGGVSGIWFYCNGQGIQGGSNGELPSGSAHYKAFSVYYSSDFGFWVLRGDASNPPVGEAWHSLGFGHDHEDYSSHLTNVPGLARTLRCQRPDQMWPKMLLPDIYHSPSKSTYPGYGGLTGELSILLALIAFSMQTHQLSEMLPHMFTNGRWQVHGLPHGRIHQRGVIVYIYTCPSNWGSGYSAEELHSYEDGECGNYYD